MFSDDMSASASGYDGLEQSSDGWLADCLVTDSMYVIFFLILWYNFMSLYTKKRLA